MGEEDAAGEEATDCSYQSNVLEKRNQCHNKTADQLIHLNSKNEDGLEDVAERVHGSEDEAGEVGHHENTTPELQGQQGHEVCHSCKSEKLQHSNTGRSNFEVCLCEKLDAVSNLFLSSKTKRAPAKRETDPT